MSDQEAVAKRLERLEKQCRRLRIAVAALGIMLVAVIGLSMSPMGPAIGQASTADMIQARRFVLVDAAGHSVAELGPSKEEKGLTALTFFRPDGTTGVMLGANQQQDSVLVLAGKGEEQPKPWHGGRL